MQNRLKYFLSFLIIVFSGLNFFSQIWTKLFFVLIAVLFFINLRKKIAFSLIVVVGYVVVLMAIQSMFWGGSLFTVLTYIALFIFVPYCMIKKIGYDYNKYIVNIIFIYAIISLIFWTLTNISPMFHEYLYGLAERLGTDPVNLDNPIAGRPEQFILYTYESGSVGGILRNPGPFHEPGAFAVFLIYGIIFNTIISSYLWNKKNIVMSVALISTFSTAGYLSFLILIVFSILISKFKIGLKISLFTILILFAVFFYSSSEFMGAKINEQYTNESSISLDTPTSGRILGARKAIYVLGEYPLWGRGLQASTKASADSPEGSGYGFMDFAARIGIPAILLFFFFFYKSIKQFCFYYDYNKAYTKYAFIALIFVLFSQQHIQSILFFMLFLSSIINPHFGEQNLIKTNTCVLKAQ